MTKRKTRKPTKKDYDEALTSNPLRNTPERNPWRRNRGKQPVGDGVIVDVRFKDGDTCTGCAQVFRWFRGGWGGDITIWRYAEEPVQATDGLGNVVTFNGKLNYKSATATVIDELSEKLYSISMRTINLPFGWKLVKPEVPELWLHLKLPRWWTSQTISNRINRLRGCSLPGKRNK